MIRFGLSDLDELPSLKEFEQLAQAALGSDTGIAPAEPGEAPVETQSDRAISAQTESGSSNDLGDDNDLAELGEDVPEVPVTHAQGIEPDDAGSETDETPDGSKAASAAAGNSEPS